MVHMAAFDSPVGKLLLTSDGTALTGLWMDRPYDGTPDSDPVLEKAAAWLEGYFRGVHRPVEFPLAPKGTAFQQLVWKQLLDIPLGCTVTYGQIAQETARQMGKARMSAQAVGQAVGANPIAIIIPCHRVWGAGGQIGGYAYGVRRKQWLIDHERKNDNAVCENP